MAHARQPQSLFHCCCSRLPLSPKLYTSHNTPLYIPQPKAAHNAHPTCPHCLQLPSPPHTLAHITNHNGPRVHITTSPTLVPPPH